MRALSFTVFYSIQILEDCVKATFVQMCIAGSTKQKKSFKLIFNINLAMPIITCKYFTLFSLILHCV